MGSRSTSRSCSGPSAPRRAPTGRRSARQASRRRSRTPSSRGISTAFPGGAGDRPSRSRHRPLLRPGRPGRDHGCPGERDRGAAPGARRPVRPRPARGPRAVRLPPSAPARRAVPDVPLSASVAGIHARAGEFGARLEGASEIHASVHYERAGLRREAFDAALAGAREAARLSARREAFELYHRAVNNMPETCAPRARGDPGGLRRPGPLDRGARGRRVAGGPRRRPPSRSRRPGPRRHVLANALTVWRREGRPVSERLALTTRSRPSGRPPDSRDVLEARALIRAVDGADLHGCPVASTGAARARPVAALATSFRDPEWRRSPSGSTGVRPTCSSVTLDAGSPASASSPTRRAAGWESTGVTAFREASTPPPRPSTTPPAVRWIDEGIRYADSIEQSHCAHVMRATLAMVSWAAADPSDAQRRARRAIVDKGCRRGAMTAHWALATSRCPVASSTMRPRH